MVAGLNEGEPGRPAALRISLVFGRLPREIGLAPMTLAYARVVAAIELTGARDRQSEHRETVATAAVGELMGPSAFQPLGPAVESAALRTILGLTPLPPGTHTGTWVNPAGDPVHLKSEAAIGAGVLYPSRLEIVKSFRKKRANAFAAARNDATAALAAQKSAPIDYFA